MNRALVVLDAPSNLGLRPPAPGVVPGCYKLAGALRDQGIVDRLGARDGGVVVPPRYDVSQWRPGDGVFNADALTRYTRRLADRVSAVLDAGERLVLLGGDCSILLGPMLALRRRGRTGLVYVDGHADFRHAGNSAAVGASAGEGLAIVTGRGDPRVAAIDGLGPYVAGTDTVALGMHELDDPLLAEARAAVAFLADVPAIRDAGPDATARAALAHLDPTLDALWVHLDVDVLDPSVMPAVDSPEPGGLEPAELAALLTPVLADPRTIGIDIAIYDPDLDEEGTGAALLVDLLVDLLG